MVIERQYYDEVKNWASGCLKIMNRLCGPVGREETGPSRNQSWTLYSGGRRGLYFEYIQPKHPEYACGVLGYLGPPARYFVSTWIAAGYVPLTKVLYYPLSPVLSKVLWCPLSPVSELWVIAIVPSSYPAGIIAGVYDGRLVLFVQKTSVI